MSSMNILLILVQAVLVFGSVEHHQGSLRSRLDNEAFQSELKTAMAEVMGCGGAVDEEHLASIEKTLLPIWKTLPQNADGRIERRMLRYTVHRFFSQQSSLVIRGFEPTRPVSGSWGNADILGKQVPAFVEKVLDGNGRGFTLHDTAQMIAFLEQLIFDSESTTLLKSYKALNKPTQSPLTKLGVNQVLDMYMLHWVGGDDEEGIQEMVKDETLRVQYMPHWTQMQAYTSGEVTALQYKRFKAAQKSAGAQSSSGGLMAEKFTFEDAHAVVGGITKNFASFWESECIVMKEALFGMDQHHTGRVPLAKFYGKGLDADWRFGESESYLREMGVLDETSGKQVMIANYIQAASNCIVTAPHYLVCCQNDCNGIMSQIEQAVAQPVVEPELILAVVRNMTTMSTIDDDAPVPVNSLKSQLQSIADASGGKVPLHGRLFAQWVHFAFPRECPYPYKSGSVATSLSPSEFGSSYIATEKEMNQHAALANSSTTASKEEQWMSQWSEEEELHGDYAGHLPSTGRTRKAFLLLGALLLAFAMITSSGPAGKGQVKEHALPLYSSKSHYV